MNDLGLDKLTGIALNRNELSRDGLFCFFLGVSFAITEEV